MRKIYLGLLVMLMMPLSVLAIDLGGVTLPDTMQAEQELTLNGAGIRTKLVFELYVAGLYLTNQSDDAAAIIAADEAMGITLHIISSKITSKKMIKATRKGFQHAMGGDTTAIEGEIEQFLAAFSDEINKGDVFEFIYEPSTGTAVHKNGLAKGIIESVAFKQALFGIWLSDKPAQASLKTQLLGK